MILCNFVIDRPIIHATQKQNKTKQKQKTKKKTFTYTFWVLIYHCISSTVEHILLFITMMTTMCTGTSINICKLLVCNILIQNMFVNQWKHWFT